MNVGLDLHLVNTNTLEVADVISYQKQIIGRQISAGVFDFLGTNFFDLSAGESALEPIQLAVRSVIERAALEMVTRIYRIPPGGMCASPLNTAADGAPALAAVAAAAAEGTISVEEALAFSQLVDAFIRALEAGEIEARLQRLESVNGITG